VGSLRRFVPTPAHAAAFADPPLRGGIRKIYSAAFSDNLRKGAALNAVQIAETLVKRKLIAAKQKAA
jgi:aspartate-semialdehyde dehydrogenase